MPTIEEQIRLIADAAVDALDLDAAWRATPREAVVDHMPVADTWSPVQFPEDVTPIDVKFIDPSEPPQKRSMRVVAAGILAAAAAVVAIVFVASSDIADVAPADEPPTTVPATQPPRALPNGDSMELNGNAQSLPPGTYFFDGTPTAKIVFTVVAGWEGAYDNLRNSGGIMQYEIGFISFNRPEAVFSDPCHWSDGYYPGSVETFDGLVAALSAQGGWADVSDISVDGYAGKAFQLTLPAEISDCDTMPNNWNPHRPTAPSRPYPAFRIWESGPYEPGEAVTVWVLDIDGTVVVIHTRLFASETTRGRALAGPPAAALADYAAVLDSIRIEPG